MFVTFRRAVLFFVYFESFGIVFAFFLISFLSIKGIKLETDLSLGPKLCLLIPGNRAFLRFFFWFFQNYLKKEICIQVARKAYLQYLRSGQGCI